MSQQHKRLATSALVATVVAVGSVWAASTYVGPSGGQWDVAANWNQAGYPGGPAPATDHDARINAGSTVNLGAVLSVSLSNLQLNAASGANRAVVNVLPGADMTVAPQLILAPGSRLIQTGGTINATTFDYATGSAGLTDPAIFDLSAGTLNVTNLRVARTNTTGAQADLSATGQINIASGGFLYVAGGTNSIGAFNMSGGTVTLNNTAQMLVAGVGTGSALFHQSGGVFNNANANISVSGVNGLNSEFRLSGGTFHANGRNLDNSQPLASRGIVTISGGTLNMGGGNLMASRENSNVNAAHVVSITGGTITGVNEMWGGVRLDGSTATLVVGSNPNAASVTTLPNFNRGELQLLDGTVVFTAFGDNSASQLVRVTGFQQGILDLTGGTIAIQFGAGYTPLPGHSFDLVNGNLAGELSVANLSTTSYDGLWQIEWDASQWENVGVLTIVSASTKIPEPASFSLLALAGLAFLKRRGRG